MTLRAYFFPRIRATKVLNASNLNLTGNAAGGRAVMDSLVQFIRNSMRVGDGLGFAWNQALPASYKVSDIVRFLGNGSSAECYAFEVKDTVNKRSWAFILPGRDQTQDQMSRGDQYVVGGSANAGVYAQLTSSSPSTAAYSITTPVFQVFYNPDTDLGDFDFGFNNPVNLTYTLGDFPSPVPAQFPLNTTIKANAFLPSHAKTLKGMYTSIASSSGEIQDDLMIVFDDDTTNPALYCFHSTGADNDLVTSFIMGKIIDSRTDGDTFLDGCFWVNLNTTGTAYGDPSSGEGYAIARTSAGVLTTNYNMVPRKTITYGNEIDPVTLNYIWNRVNISIGANDKGWISGNVIREIGAFNASGSYRARYAAPTSGDCMVKFVDSYAIRYPANVPSFPFNYRERF
jgi:hypothetical protein